MSELPKGWIEVTLGQITSKPQYGYTTKSQSSGSVRYLRTTDLTSGKVNWETVPYCVEIPPDVSKYQLEDRDIVISRAGSVGFHSLISSPPEDVVFASYLIRFKPSIFVNERYLSRFLNSQAYWSQITEKAAGVAVQNVNAVKLADLRIPLAPLNEQKRIADKLDSTLAKVNRAQARLDKIPGILKRFRQSVLAAATSGELTREWRELSGSVWEVNKYIVAQVVRDARYSIGIGPFGSNLKVDDYRDEGHPLVFVREIRARDFGSAKTKYVNNDKFKELVAHRVKPGNILLTKMGDPPGDVAIYPEHLPEAVITSDCIKLDINEDRFDKRFVFYYFQSEHFQKQIGAITAGVAQQKVNLKNFRGLELSIPSRTEQHEIVSKVEALLTKVHKVEKQYLHAKARLERVTQAILAKAFRGELVLQDLNEEPAEKLLERIKVANSSTKSKKK